MTSQQYGLSAAAKTLNLGFREGRLVELGEKEMRSWDRRG